MTSLLLPSGGKLIFLPYNLDVSVYSHGTTNAIKTIRAERISLLAISKAQDTGLVTLGVPKEVLGIVTIPDYGPSGSDPTVESVLGDLAISKIRSLGSASKFSEDRPKLACLSSVTYHGSTEDFLRWAGNLISLGLEECSEIGKGILQFIKGDPIYTDHIFTPTKNPQLKAYDNVLSKPVHFYLEDYDRDYTTKKPKEVEERTREEVEGEKVETVSKPYSLVDETIKTYLNGVNQPSEASALDSFFFDMIDPSSEKQKTVDVYEVIAKINQLGEKPAALILPPGQHYATMQQFDDHHRLNKSYDISVISEQERQAVLDYFSYIVGMNFHEATNKVRKEGMKVALGRIEGHLPIKFITTDLRRIKVKVKDPHPINPGCPSDLGIITKIMGFVIVTRNGFVE